MSSSSSSSSTSFPSDVPQHCLNAPVLYELLKGEEEHCRVWLRDEMNQIPDPLIDSLFIKLIMSSSSSSPVGSQGRSTVSELCRQLEGEKMEVRRLLRGEMDRMTDSLFERLTSKLRMNTHFGRSEDGGDRAQVGPLHQVESFNLQSHEPVFPIPQQSISAFGPNSQQQHSNGDELKFNAVNVIEIKEEVENGDETRVIDIAGLTEYNEDGEGECRSEENERIGTTQQMTKPEIKDEFDYGHEIEIKQEEDDKDETINQEVKLEIKEEEEEEGRIGEVAEDIESGDDESRSVEIAPMDSIPAHPTGQSQGNIRQSGRIEKRKKTDRESQLQMPNQVNNQEDAEDEDDEEEMSNPTNDNNVHSVVESNESSTSAQQQTNPIASKPPTDSNRQIFTKPKQSQLNRSAKKSKKTVEDEEEEEEGEEDIATDKDGDDKKVKVSYLNCTQPDCDDKLDTLDQYYEHLRNKHGLPPLQCFCGCKSRFDKPGQIAVHLKDCSASRFSCSVCNKVFSTQIRTTQHWYRNHLTGQFQCNIDDFSKVVDNRSRLRDHQVYKHNPNSKRFECPQVGCSSSFVRNKELKRHQMIHLNTKPFHCKWPKCVYRSNDRRNLIKHIRNVHIKKQQQNGIVGECDPNKYVRVLKK